MAVAIELSWGDRITLGELAQFVAHARAGGVDDGEALEAVVADNDHHLQVGWRVELGEPAGGMEAEVKLSASLAGSVVELLNLVAESDGDVRGLQEGVVKVRDELLQALLHPAV
ncbi:hypothetical protein ABIA35_008120 [Catenulispora sp. MAP12-49]|uniref:hypothetical protein n=1 Tax=Catenulispora sp. MAP12-49 TaxID=3156302 RepID=UPI003514FE28